MHLSLHRLSSLLARCAAVACFTTAAHAGLLEDDEARRAILDLRAKVDQNATEQRNHLADLTEQLNQLKRSLLDLNNQLEQLRADNAKLRGQNEQLARDLSDVQRTQKDIQSGVDDRIRKFEPQKVTLDGKALKYTATAGTLPTHGPLFVVLLVGTVVLVGALTYVPALALGPVIEQLQWRAAR